MKLRFFILVVCGLAVAATIGRAQTFQILSSDDLILGAVPSQVSADGRTVVGTALFLDQAGDRRAMAARWKRAALGQPLGLLQDGTESHALGVSANGGVITGYDVYSPAYRAFRWTRADGMQPLFAPHSTNGSIGMAVSGDGTVIVGAIDAWQGFRWSLAAGRQILANSPAQAVNYDGTAVAGGFSPWRNDVAGIGWRWTLVGGFESLGTLDPARDATCRGISGDGQLIVGQSAESGIRWTPQTRFRLMPRLYGNACEPRAVSGDGSTIVGVGYGPEVFGQTAVAFMWTSARGIVDLNTYLPSIGIDLQSCRLLSAEGVSGDGSVIVGWGRSPSAWRIGWVVRLHRICDSIDFDDDGSLGTDTDVRAFFNCLTGRCCPTCPGNADFNGDGDIGTDADIEAFFRALAGNGCG